MIENSLKIVSKDLNNCIKDYQPTSKKITFYWKKKKYINVSNYQLIYD